MSECVIHDCNEVNNMKCTRMYFPEAKMTHTEVKSLDVILDNKQRDGYCSGEVVSGHVSLKLSEATTVKTINVLLKGYAQVSWMHKRSRCSEEKKCLSLSKTLVATGRSAM